MAEPPIEQEIIVSVRDEASAKLLFIQNRMEGLEKGIGKFTTGIVQTVAATGKLVDSFGSLGNAAQKAFRATSILSGVIAGAGAAMVAFGVSAVRAADDIDDQAKSLGLTVQRYQELKLAAAEAGISQRQFNQGMAQFGKQLEAEGKRVAQTTLKLLDFAEVQPHPNIREVKPFVDTMKTVREAVLETQAAQRKFGKPVEAYDVLLKKFGDLANGTTEQKKQFEDMTGKTLPGVNAELQKLRERADQGKTGLQRLGAEVAYAEDGSVDLNKSLLNVADAFKKSDDPVKKMSIATQLFGRAMAQKMIPLLDGGSEGIEEFINSAKTLGLFLKDTAGADQAAKAIALLGAAVENAKVSFGLLFAPTIETAARGFATAISENQEVLLQLGKTINETVTPYIHAFFDAISGRKSASPEVEKIRLSFVKFGETVRMVFENIIKPAFTLFMRGLDFIADKINKVFGTEITGPMLGIALVIGKITGLFGLLGAAARTAMLILGGFASILTWPGLLATALLLIVTNFDAVKAAAQSVADVINSVFGTGVTGAQLLEAAIWLVVGALVAARFAATALGVVLSKLSFHPLVRAAALLLAIYDSVEKAGQQVNKYSGITDDAADSTSELTKEADKQIAALRAQSTAANQAAGATKNVAKAQEGVLNIQKGFKGPKPGEEMFGGAKIITIPKKPPAAQAATQAATQAKADVKATEQSTAAQKEEVDSFIAVADAARRKIGEISTELSKIDPAAVLEQSKAGAGQVFDFLKGKITELVGAVPAQPPAAVAIDTITQSATDTIPVVGQLNTALGGVEAATEKVNQAKTAFEQFFGTITSNAPAVEDALKITVPPPQKRSEAPAADNEFSAQRRDAQLLTTEVNATATAVSGVTTKTQELSTGFANVATIDLTPPVDALNLGLDATSQKLSELIAKAAELARLSAQAQANAGGGGAGGFASGGRVFGRGGIDKVPAWLTRDEFVMRTAAVRKYGLAFMNAVNRGELPGFALGGHVGAPGYAMGGLTQQGGKIYTEDQVKSLVLTISNGVNEGLEVIAKAWNDFANTLERTIGEMASSITGIIERVATPEDAMGGLQEIGRMMEGFAEGIVPTLAATAKILQSGIAKTKDAVRMASGGQVYGTPGIDKVPAFLTNDEFVMRTAAVRKYGVDFMRMVNEGRLPAFNLGGMIADGFRIPRFNEGGLVGAPSNGSSGAPTGRPLTLNFPSGASYTGTVNDVMGTFEREALALQGSSTGKAPGWVS